MCLHYRKKNCYILPKLKILNHKKLNYMNIEFIMHQKISQLRKNNKKNVSRIDEWEQKAFLITKINKFFKLKKQKFFSTLKNNAKNCF